MQREKSSSEHQFGLHVKAEENLILASQLTLSLCFIHHPLWAIMAVVEKRVVALSSSLDVISHSGPRLRGLGASRFPGPTHMASICNYRLTWIHGKKNVKTIVFLTNMLLPRYRFKQVNSGRNASLSLKCQPSPCPSPRGAGDWGEETADTSGYASLH